MASYSPEQLLVEGGDQLMGGAIRLGGKRRRRVAKRGPLPGIVNTVAKATKAKPKRRRYVSHKKMVRGKALKQILAHLGHIRKGARKLHRGRGRRLGGALRGYEYNANS